MRAFIRILAPLALLLTLLMPAGAATAAPAITERSESFAFSFNGCNGELIQGEGTAHLVIKEQKDGTFLQHNKTHAQAVGDRGNEYIANESFNTKLTNGEIAFDVRLTLISKGSAPDQAVRVRFKDGEFTSEIVCRG
jgi:hypothetical protein